MSNASYRAAGVDVEAGYAAVDLMKSHVEKTMLPNVFKGMANFGGLFALGDQILVSGTDGVGTKLKLAFTLDKHDTIGVDCVAMCVNDVVCHGAKPLFFLDYIATGHLVPEKVETIVAGVCDGCVQSGCALIGGETAEMPGFYSAEEYDLAGFSVGVVDRKKLIDGSAVREGDVLIGLASSGVHSNGFSLVRKLFPPTKEVLGEFIDALGCTLGEELLRPTRIYVKTILALNEEFHLHGVAHITGGGFHENIPRILPQGLRASIQKGNWPILPVFHLLAEKNGTPLDELFYTFNMGVGMVLAVAPEEATAVLRRAQELGEQAYEIGRVVPGEKGVSLC